MAKITRKSSSCHQLHSVRARLRRASCMNDDSYEDRNTSPASMDSSPSNQEGMGIQTSPPSEMTSQHMHADHTNQQLQSALFARLPVEIRRLIYTEIWRATSATMKLHIHAACDGARLMYTPCKCFSDHEEGDDPMRTDPWPSWRTKNQPPRWFWHAWGLRLRWGTHWRCQEQAMMAWRSRDDGTCVDERASGSRAEAYLGVFLTCKRMYAEAIESFFESMTLIFTASEDAYRFFLQQAHPYQSKIHAVGFSFTHFKDHIFLQRIESNHPRLPDQLSAPVSWEMWTPLMLCVREKLPELQRLRVHLCTPSAREDMFLDVLRTWEKEGYGKVEELADDGLVYVEAGRRH